MDYPKFNVYSAKNVIDHHIQYRNEILFFVFIDV